MPEIRRLAGEDRLYEAYRLAEQAQSYIPDDPILLEQLKEISADISINSDPAGAQVSYRQYGRPAEPWRPLGTTPISDVTGPLALLQWKAEMPGREMAEDVGPGWFDEPRIRFALFCAPEIPVGMVRIVSSGTPFQPVIPGPGAPHGGRPA